MAKLQSMPFKVGPAELRWVFCNGQGALNDLGDQPKYEYKASAVLPMEQAKPYIKQLEDFWLRINNGKKVKAKSLGYKIEEDEEGNPTGYVTFTFKTRTSFVQKDGTEKPSVVRIFRSNGAEITNQFHAAEKKVANGSEGIIHGIAAEYGGKGAIRGITLYLQGIQFTKYVPYQSSIEVEALDVDDGLDDGDGLDVAPVEGHPVDI